MIRRLARKIFPLLAVALVTALAAGCHRDDNSAPKTSAKPSVVLYCAVDREIAQDIIDQFEKESGIHVESKFDTEAAKAVGLVQEIRQEKANPHCDVLWGGGPFFCTMLADDGCLAPAPNDLLEAHGAAPRDAIGRWLGFAAAYRILIVNTNLLPPDAYPHSYRDLADPKFQGHIGIANPLFGGMAAHVAALFAKLGESAGRQWLADLKRNHCAVCAGMADVKNRVASGELWFGLTATDDAFVALEGGKPVTVVFPDQEPGGLGCFSGCSAVALISGAPHPAAAEKLVRFLMTTQTEKILATGPGQSVGMLPASVAADVRPPWIPKGVYLMNVDWNETVKAHAAAAKAIKEILLDE